MSTRLRRAAAVFAVVALLAAACGGTSIESKTDDDTSTDTPTETVPVTGDDINGDTFAGLEHSSTAPAIALCDALATRDVSAVMDLMAADAIAEDHAAGAIYTGEDEIRAWFDRDLSFALFEDTMCARSETAIASHFWSAITYAFSSDTTPGGTEGIIVAGVAGGAITRFDLLYSPRPDETHVDEEVSTADRATLSEWCEAWGALDVGRVLALTTGDVLVVPKMLAADQFFRPPLGAEAITGAMDFVTGGNLDRNDCSDHRRIANGGWIAGTNLLVDDDSGKTLGGVYAIRLRDGLVSSWSNFNDIMVDDTPFFDATQPQPPPDPTVDPAVVDTVAALEAIGWWEFAGGYLGADLEPGVPRNDIAADVIDVCAFLATRPASLDDFLAELDRLGERRAARLGAADAPAYSLVLDTAISAACPGEATAADALRPPIDPPNEPDLVARRVGDPRPGDLRTDPTADVLPADYEAPTIFWTISNFPYGSDPSQQLDLYLPAPDKAQVPVILFLHSGGWITGGPSPVPRMVMRFVERGYAVVSIGYRLAPAHTFPAQIHDVKRAIRELKVFGEREGLIDGDRIIVFGTSAGGHLAALAGATPGSFEPADLTPEQATFDSTVAGVVSVVGPTDLISFHEQSIWPDLAATFLGCEACSATQLAEASPLTHLGPDLPPAYWAYGANDDVVDPTAQGAAIASAWAEQAGPASSWFDLIEGHGHNIPHWAINQRELEKFVAYAVAQR